MKRLGKIVLWLLIGWASAGVLFSVLQLLLSLIGSGFGDDIESVRDVLFIVALIGTPLLTGLILGIANKPYRKFWMLPFGCAAIATAVFLLIDLIIAIATGVDLASVLFTAFFVGLLAAPGGYVIVLVIDG